MTNEAVLGLSCPRCGGMVPVPEGQAVVVCPYCDQRSLVAAEAHPSAPMGAGAAQSGAGALPGGAGAAQSGAGAGPGGLLQGVPPKGVPPQGVPPQGVPPLPTPGQSPVSFILNEIQFAAQADAASKIDAGGPTLDQDEAAMALGVRRYQAPLQITREQAIQALGHFLAGKFQVARDAARQAKLSEAFLVHLPFWAVWGRAAAYGFGQEKVGSGDHERYEAREKRVVKEMTWNVPACEVGEFGVRQVSLEGCQLQPFRPDDLHRTGMVFEPVGSALNALETARASFEEEVRDKVKLDRTGQIFTRLLRARMGLVYYPLWVLRYLYRGRAFQIVVDGSNGQVLYGKAPGSVGYRAGVLVGGMAVGALVGIDLPAAILSGSSNSSHSSDNPLIFALIVFAAGMGILYTAYRTFRYGEQYEYHRFGKPKGLPAGGPALNLPGRLSDVNSVIRTLEKFQ